MSRDRLSSWCPAGADPADYAVQLLGSLNGAEVDAARAWLLENPDAGRPRLRTALDGPTAPAAATLLGQLGEPDDVPALVAAHHEGSEVVRLTIEAALTGHGTPEASRALAELRAGG